MVEPLNLARYRLWLCWLLVILALAVTPLAASAFGAAELTMADVLQLLWQKLWQQAAGADGSGGMSITERIIWELRLPRVLLAFIAGAGLALCGDVLQSVTRNPLADPYLFGISSGAAFGAVMALFLAGDSAFSWISLPLGAFVGACGSVLLVLTMASGRAEQQIERMLLSGVAVSFMFGAFTSLMLFFSSPQVTATLLFWTLGSFARADWGSVWLPGLVVLVALGLVVGFRRQILAMLGGDETAHTLGVRVMRMRLGMLLLCSLVTAILVAYCGGIGFVGLMIPHLLRLLLPGRHPLVLTVLTGGVFMVWVDVLARSLLPTQELPVGVITSALGSIFFLAVLRYRKQ